VGLVDRHETDVARRQGVEKRGRCESLRGAVDDAGASVANAGQRVAVSLFPHSRRDHDDGMPFLHEAAALIGHERDQGAHDDGELG
jgi:hypothetical protein